MAGLPSDAERFSWLERPNDDFPYYRGRPVRISARGWLVVLVGVALGLFVLMQGPKLVSGVPAKFLIAFLYSAIPLATLALVARQHWIALFRRLRGSDFLWMVGFAILNLVVTLLVGQITIRVIETTPNQAISGIGQMATGDRLIAFALTGIQLIGEEVMSILPFLALTSWLCGQGGMVRKRAIVVATLIVAVLFSAEHLPTYNWNVLQTLMGVGVARIVLLLPYIMTKNLAVSSGAHILNDWMFFGVSILSASVAATS